MNFTSGRHTDDNRVIFAGNRLDKDLDWHFFATVLQKVSGNYLITREYSLYEDVPFVIIDIEQV